MTPRIHRSLAGLGPEWDPLFAAGPGAQSRRAWFEATEAAALPAGAAPHLIGLESAGRPVALLPMQSMPGTARLTSLTSPYSVLFQPLLVQDPVAAGRALGRCLRAWPVVLLEALDPGWAELPAFLSGLRRAGLVADRFEHFGNWHEVVAGLGWPAYLAARPGALRETLRRKGRLAQRDLTVRFEIVGSAEGLEAAMAAYESVYARSWKVPEPFPDFTAALLTRLAPAGAMRLGVMWHGEQAVAAQYWTLDGGVATVLKLAHDDTAKALSPGTLLTAHMIRSLIEDGVSELDFGRGDDPYKRQWARDRRQRIGLVLVNPLRPLGLATLARHRTGRLLRLLRRLLPQR